MSETHDPSPTADDPSAVLAGRNVLVTGAGGFIGARLARRLVELGAEVHATTRRVDDDRLPRGVQAHTLDLADADAVDDLFAEVRPRHVFHLASHVAGSRDLDLVRPTLHDNLCSTVYLMEAAARHGCDRFVQVGSLEEPDSVDAAPSSPYAAAKAAATAYGRMFHELYDLGVVTARLFMVYGPGRQDERKLVPYVVRSLLAGDTPTFSSGTRPVDWIFVDDVVEGLVRLGTSPDLAGRRIDLGSGTLHTVREVVETLFRILEAPEPPTFGSRGDRAAEQVRKADLEPTHRLLHWQPATSLEEGLTRTVEWFRSR